MRIPLLVVVLAALLPAGCSTISQRRLAAEAPPLTRAAESLRLARRASLPAEQRAAWYLTAAAATAPLLDGTATPARRMYNDAAAELTDLLREAPEGRLWNRPLTLADGTTWSVRFHPGVRGAAWSPEVFTDFQPARKVGRGTLRRRVVEDGVGGTLVGIRRGGDGAARRARFEPRRGQVAPVTATLDFRGRDATLTLHDPAVSRAARVKGRTFPLAADFTAPLATLPVRNEFLHGLLGMVRVEQYLDDAGLYLLHPYDPDRIPVILIHGLLSTPQMWRNVVNEVEAAPDLRGRFQFAVFQYPTGNPLLFSAMQCREDLARLHRLHPGHPGLVLVGHSMGGLVARLQVTDFGRVLWNETFRERAEERFAELPADNVVKRSLVFRANPDVDRVVFICVPHRGSLLAVSSLGSLAMKLIRLPATLVSTFTSTLGDALETVAGRPQIPNSIRSLSPRNPALLTMDRLPIRAPHHSIIGDRGRGDLPHSSDGVVAYASAHLATAASEFIVPGGHSSHEHPQTIAELTRILRAHRGRSAAGR